MAASAVCNKAQDMQDCEQVRRMKVKSAKFTSYIASTHECCIAIRIVNCININVLQTRNKDGICQ